MVVKVIVQSSLYLIEAKDLFTHILPFYPMNNKQPIIITLFMLYIVEWPTIYPKSELDLINSMNNGVKVCHSSVFQTISRRSVYIKIINHSDSISANLHNTIQTKQHAMKKPHSNSNRNKIYKGLFFVVGGFWAENVQNLQFLLIQ